MAPGGPEGPPLDRPVMTPGRLGPPGSPWTFLPVPLVTYDSDNGIGAGVAAALFYNDGVTEPYRLSLIGQLLITTVGVSQDYLKLDYLNLLGTGVRLNAEARFLTEPNASYFGLGNLTPSTPTGNPAYYQYDQTNPAMRLELRHSLAGPLFLYAGYTFEYAFITAYKNSLLSENPITGVAGGSNSPLQAGLVYDSRDFEPWPRHGTYDEISARTAGSWTLSAYQWTGATAIVRAYQALPWDLVVANRLLFDIMVGSVPFYDEDSTGGLEEMDGLGGFASMRGFVKDRFMGPVKLLDNLELRRFFYSMKLLGQDLDLGAILFTDVGRVWKDVTFDDGPFWFYHWDVGAGLRAMLNHDLVVRADLGVSVEGPRIYILFGNLF
ncbi:MAG: Omp85 family outer membrane protein [Deltaproteobacteria bacterium]